MLFVSDDHQFLVVNSLWEKAGVPREGWSPQMAVTNFKNLCEKDKSYFDSTLLFVKYLGLKLI